MAGPQIREHLYNVKFCHVSFPSLIDNEIRHWFTIKIEAAVVIFSRRGLQWKPSLWKLSFFIFIITVLDRFWFKASVYGGVVPEIILWGIFERIQLTPLWWISTKFCIYFLKAVDVGLFCCITLCCTQYSISLVFHNWLNTITYKGNNVPFLNYFCIIVEKYSILEGIRWCCSMWSF